ncbi:EscU/YscU/HrcU family type III secretion system export apparatus switch protein [Streptomyces sp. NP160]|uniref:EscU/YscU/HrcU family type III secretion system export apparatus switch protein n=1 Tax=Streptomyces sp. NP160 TaxID=2586637 RepID=UPI0011199AD6|nr:EscU/YscU/HrcU family type III secretion system export apparatus switch protein [Streptomyces sp. NP160]TNM69403.1 EscU/YscU/HrcU family type III secretion system export apparatus switch protein [Streptomyces sp. NP160]
MSAGGGGGEKTEKPTPKRLQDARKKGQIARTPDLGAWAGLGVIVAVIPMVIAPTRERLQAIAESLDVVAKHPEPALMLQALGAGGAAIVPAVAPLLAVAVVVAVVASVGQGGFVLATQAAKPNWQRLDVLKGIKNLFSVVNLWQLVKSLVKTAIIGGVLWVTVQGLVPQLLSGGGLTLAGVLDATSGGVASLVRIAVGAGLMLAVVDFAVQKAKTMKDLRMTKQEIKDESKNSEGNPEIKAAIKGKQRAMSRNRMMAAVGEADVVLVNPTHVAVALKYEPNRGAPRVVAKGSGHTAARIRARASETGVPLVSDVPLARALYAACELEQEVPMHLYVAVAQVLAFVMALKKRGSASGLHANPAPVAVEVPDHPLLRGLPTAG